MRQDHRFRKTKGLTDGQKRILSISLIPLVVIVLIAVIVIADHAGGKDALPESSMTVAPDDLTAFSDGDEGAESQEAGEEAVMDESREEAEGEGDTFATDSFQKDSVPEILELMKTYFQARVQADAETMNQLYGIEGVSEEALEAQKTKMRSNAKYVSDFQNISTYVMNGTTTDSWLVYTLADIKFYTAKTAAPMIMWCYVQKNAEGVYQILDNGRLSSNVLLFIDAANHSQEVRSLAADVNGRLKKALSEDEDLNSIYGVIRDGSPVWQEDESEAAVVVLDGTDQSGESTDPPVEDGADTGNAEAGTSPETEGNTEAGDGSTPAGDGGVEVSIEPGENGGAGDNN